MNPVFLEVLRYRLDAVCEEAGLTIERTAISPVVVESKDYGVMLCDANGRLITGAGVTRTHFFAAENSVQATIERHGDTVRPGDVFIANDPHNGGGLHPQDVFVLSPVYHQNKLCAWVATTAHMMDMGMVPGSFAPGATECYQEAFRFPPVLVIRDGQEQKDVWIFFSTMSEWQVSLISTYAVLLPDVISPQTSWPVWSQAVTALTTFNKRLTHFAIYLRWVFAHVCLI